MRLTQDQKAELEAQIVEMKKQRDGMISDANLNIAHVAGRIKQLEELITPPTPPEEEPEPETKKGSKQ